MQELDERCARSGPSCDPRRNVNLTGGAPICFGETIIDGQVPDEFIEDFLARKIRRILGESPKAAHTKPCGAGVPGQSRRPKWARVHSMATLASGPCPVRGTAQWSPKT